MIDKSKKEPLLPTTDWGSRPGDFPLGSVESRAAARFLFEHGSDEPEMVIIHHIQRPVRDGKPVDWTKRQEGPRSPGQRIRLIYEPPEPDSPHRA